MQRLPKIKLFSPFSLIRIIPMAKRPHSVEPTDPVSMKRVNVSMTFNPIKVATAEAGAAVDADTPLSQLTKLLSQTIQKPKAGTSVVYWMRMHDLRRERQI